MELKCKAITAVLLALASTAWAGWELETVASEGDVGDGCCLAVDRWGRPHISYVDKTGGNVMYARYVDSSWEFEAVASDVDVPGNTAIALDPTDKPHIIFHDAKTGELTYAYRSGTNWLTETVYTRSGYFFQFVSITAWPPGPRVSYSMVGSSSPSLSYAYRDGEGWHPTGVSSGGGQSNTLFLDDNNNPNIVYYNISTSSVRRAVLKNEEWSIDDIAEGVDPGAVVGPDDKIHVGFPTLSNDGLNYAVSTSGGSWKIENVPRVVGEPAYTDIAVNAAANVFLSYFNFNKSNLHVMIKKGAAWTHEVVATGAYVGLPHSSGVTGSRPMIAYYHGDKQDLMLARYDPNLGIEPLIPADRHPGEAKPGTFALFQNVPNPASGSTTFSFELAEGSNVKLAVYDAAGRKVADVAHRYFAAGRHDVPFTRELAPGVYVYRLDAGAKTAARKMVVIK
ncbi:MAG: T9SS type A sorting domain-containing protein [bacterium]